MSLMGPQGGVHSDEVRAGSREGLRNRALEPRGLHSADRPGPADAAGRDGVDESEVAGAGAAVGQYADVVRSPVPVVVLVVMSGVFHDL